jgi:isocitrate/isopropylmalate dehydrogenase
MADGLRIIVLEGDETGQELLEQALRVLDPAVTRVDVELEHYDLSLENRRKTSNEVVERAAAAMGEARFGLKAATITPEGADDVGSPNRIVREGVEGADDEIAYRTEKVTRSTCRAVAEYAFRMASRMGARVYGGPKWTVSPVYEGMLKEEMDAAAQRHPDVPYSPVLIDATYAGLMTGAAETPLVIPALNRDGDCLSDLVLPMFGSIAGAESVLLSFDADYGVEVAMAEAPHGTAPSLMGKDLANPMAMLLACGSVLSYAAVRGEPGADRASRAIYESVLETAAGGVKTFDLGGSATTSEFTDAVVEKVRTKVEIWSTLGAR